jgi:ABC-type multidrug transport system fused ATPase/permease subunit
MSKHSAIKKKQLLYKLSSLKLSYFTNKNPIEIIELITKDVNSLSDIFILHLNIFIRTSIQSLSIIYIFYNIGIKLELTVLVFLLCFIQLLCQYLYHKYIYHKTIHYKDELLKKQHNYIDDYIHKINTYKTNCLEKELIDSYICLEQQISINNIKESLFYGIDLLLSHSYNTSIIYFIIVYGINNNISLSIIHQIILYIDSIISILESYRHIINNTYKNIYAIKRIKNVLTIPDNKNNKIKYIPVFQPDIYFNNITFSYNDSTIVYQNFNKAILFGTKLGIYGISGIGKSTLLKLLIKQYNVNNGNIYFDNINIQNIDDEFYYNDIISYIGQEPVLLELNYKLNSKTETMQEFTKDIVKNKMSGGQKQRYTICNILNKNNPIVLMDEPTSALDNKNQKLFIEIMKAKYIEYKFTFIIVSHNLSLLQELCNEILYL